MDNWKTLVIWQAIQTVLGLVAVGMKNPKSGTLKALRDPLRTLRDSLNTLPLDDK
jgi:hypothetical protein